MRTLHFLGFGLLLVILFGCGTGALFYYPEKELVTTPDKQKLKWSELEIPVGKTDTLHGWLIEPHGDSPPLATVLQFHGNAANISYQYQAVVPLVEAGYQAIVFDYRGYGQSTGKANQENLLEDGLAAFDYTVSLPEVQNQKLLLFGQSLGGHLSVVVANKRRGDYHALVIEGAFTGHNDIAAAFARRMILLGFVGRLMAPSRYDAIDVIDSLQAPLTVIHSVNDEVIPFKMGEELFNAATCEKSFWKARGPHIGASREDPSRFVETFETLRKKP